jgi:hypothetical protein
MEPQSEPLKTADSATSTTPRIVNGMPFRPPKTINIWKGLGFVGISLVPDVVLLLAVVPLAVRSLLKYFDTKGLLPSQPDIDE